MESAAQARPHADRPRRGWLWRKRATRRLVGLSICSLDARWHAPYVQLWDPCGGSRWSRIASRVLPCPPQQRSRWHTPVRWLLGGAPSVYQRMNVLGRYALTFPPGLVHDQSPPLRIVLSKRLPSLPFTASDVYILDIPANMAHRSPTRAPLGTREPHSDSCFTIHPSLRSLLRLHRLPPFPHPTPASPASPASPTPAPTDTMAHTLPSLHSTGLLDAGRHDRALIALLGPGAQRIPLLPSKHALPGGVRTSVPPLEFGMSSRCRRPTMAEVTNGGKRLVHSVTPREVPHLPALSSSGFIKLCIRWPGYDEVVQEVSFKNENGQADRGALLMNVVEAYVLFLHRITRRQEREKGMRSPEWSIYNMEENKCNQAALVILRLHHVKGDYFQAEMAYAPDRLFPSMG